VSLITLSLISEHSCIFHNSRAQLGRNSIVGVVWCLVRGGSEEIVPFRTWEVVSKFSSVWMLLGSLVWKMLSVWMVMWKWKWKSWPQSWPQN